MQAECLVVSAASKDVWCVLATPMVCCSEGQRQGDHRRLQNSVEGAGLAWWWSGGAVRAGANGKEESEMTPLCGFYRVTLPRQC